MIIEPKAVNPIAIIASESNKFSTISSALLEKPVEFIERRLNSDRRTKSEITVTERRTHSRRRCF